MHLLVRLVFLLLFVLMPPCLSWGAPQPVKIGVLAKRGPELALNKWSLTAEYLSSSIPGLRFEIVPLGFREIHAAAKEGHVDFILANPAFYVELEQLYGVSRIATLINQGLPGQRTTIFGGVIFCRADRQDISDASDLRGKSFMAVDPSSFGGWIMAWREFKQKGLDPLEDFSSLQYGTTHDEVVYAVLNGEVDAGTVRTDTLERMAESGAIRLKDFRILEQRRVEGFPFLLSTALYPEWPIAAVRTTPNKLARLVASSLMAMEADHPAAVASKTAGWTIPLNYQPVHECLLELRIGPYKDYGKFTLTDVLIRYWRQLVLVFLAVTSIIAVALYILALNRRLRQKKAEVDELNRTLEAKVVQRTEKINALLDQETYLRKILQTVAVVDELLITSPNLERLLVDACAKFIEHGYYCFCWIGLLAGQDIEEVYTADRYVTHLADPPYPVADAEHLFSQSPTARCIVANISVVEQDSLQKTDTTPWRKGQQITGFEAVIALPLRADQFAEPLGVLTVYSIRKQGFEAEEVAMLEELAGDIGFAISSFRQKEAVRKLEIERTANYEETIFSMVNMIEQRDTYTAGHTARVAKYCEMIAREMGLDEQQIHNVKKAAILHDIGKIATPDSVLLKPGKLNDLDYDLIKVHAFAGYEMLSKINMYKKLAEIIRHHHERHDGNGYPDHLRGDDIPLLARIMVVADAFDAMTTNRIYKPKKEPAEALAELKALSGSQFHPEVVKAALSVLQNVEIPATISQRPTTELEKRRFSYFFNDKLTGLYNEDYLQVILKDNRDLHMYKCLHTVHLRNLPAYNKRQGWEKGNLLFKRFAGELQADFPDTLIFRAYGNDFVLISREHFEVDPGRLQSFASIKDTEIEVETLHVDLMPEKIYTVDKLDKLKLTAGETGNFTPRGDKGR